MERTGNVLGVVKMMGRQQIMSAVTDVDVGFTLLAHNWQIKPQILLAIFLDDFIYLTYLSVSLTIYVW